MGCTGAHCTRMVLRASEKASSSSAARLLSSVSSSSSSGATAWRSLAAVLEKKLWICPAVRNPSTLNFYFRTTHKTGSGNEFSLNPMADIFSLILPSFVGDWPLDILGEECRNPKIKIAQA